MNNFPFVSIIIPCRNEEKFIAKCLDSIIANDYPKDKIEILIVDGMSEDETRDIVREYAQKYPFIKLLNNNKKITPVALNFGINQANGEIIFTLSAHVIYEKDYISKCTKYLSEYGADDVGGIMKTVPENDTILGKAIIFALSNKFGVGNSYFRIGSKEPKFVDTVPFGCYRREVFEKIGLFNENLVRNQDIEFNLRLKKAGGKILLAPDIVSYYYARSNLKGLFRQNFLNGFWVIYSNKFAKTPFSLRHLVPFVFVFSLIGSLLLSIFWLPFIALFFGIFGIYLLANIFFSLKLAVKNGLHLFPLIVVSFFALHFSYGIGSLWGLIRLVIPKKTNVKTN